MTNTDNIMRVAAALLFAGLLTACAGAPPRGTPAAGAAGDDPLATLAALQAALQREPRNAELRSDYLRRREALIRESLAAAEQAAARGDHDDAAQRYRDVLSIDPRHPRARQGIDALIDERRRAARLAQAGDALARGELAAAERLARSVLAEAPADARARRLLRDIDERRLQTRPVAAPTGPLARRVSLTFRDAPLRVVFEALSQAAGLNFVFDSEIRDDALVSLVVRDTTVDEVIRLVAATQQIERKLLNENSVLIYPATPAKQREYLELVSRSFYLAHADVKQAEVLLRQLAKIREVFIDEKLNLVVIKDAPAAVSLAERLVAALDVAEAEVMLEVEVLEVTRSKLQHLGIEFPDQIGYGRLEDGSSGLLTPGNVSIRSGGSGLLPFVSNPAAVLLLRREDDDTNLLANPRIRVKNRAEARIHIGERLPVFTTTSTANVGVSASVTYLDVGLKLDVVPSVTLDDEVAIRVALEVSSIVREVPGPEGSLAYQLGTRSASTTLRLQNGETQVLAGLINDEDRRGARRVPGLGDLPLLGRLFSAHRDNALQTEIVLLITPRVIRNIVPPVFTRDHLPAGTEASVGAEALRIGPTAPDSLSLRGTGVPGPQPVAPPPAASQAEATGAAPADVSVSLVAPESVQPGAMLTLTVNVGGRGAHEGGLLEFDYDPALLEPVGFAGPAAGQGTVALPAGTLPTSVPLAFRVKPDAKGEASVIATGLVLQVSGERAAMPVAGTASVKIGE